MNSTTETKRPRRRQLRQFASSLFFSVAIVAAATATVFPFGECGGAGIATTAEGCANNSTVTDDHRNDIADRKFHQNMLTTFNDDQIVERVLSRHRRYLIFPEGSSFQVVYDQIVGVVDYTNYLILGITAALAWELPSKPPSEILSDLETRLRDGTLDISRNDTEKNVFYVDNTRPSPKFSANSFESNEHNYWRRLTNRQQHPFHPPMSMRRLSKFKFNPEREMLNRKTIDGSRPIYLKEGSKRKGSQGKSSFSYKSNPLIAWTRNTSLNPGKHGRYPWWNLQTNRIAKNGKNRHPPELNRNAKDDDSHRSFSNKLGKHQIYPVFGKRSIRPTSNQHRHRRNGIQSPFLSKVDRIHIRHHRSTRHNLYGKIEKYLNAHGSTNGHECVLKALCETGQKGNELEPGTFVGEIMRAIFTMPEAVDSDVGLHLENGNYKQQKYDLANGYHGDCAARYHECKQSLWEADFVS